MRVTSVTGCGSGSLVDFRYAPIATTTARRCNMSRRAKRWGNRPAQLVDSWRFLGAALQADGETRSVVTASSIRRRSATWTILLDWTYRSRRPAFALWMRQAGLCGKQG